MRHGTAAPRQHRFLALRPLASALAALLLLAALIVASPATPVRAATGVVTDCGSSAATTGTLPAVFNTVNTGGGAVYVDTGGTATISGCTVTGNTGDFGGAIFNDDGTAMIVSSTLTGNTANVGGALYLIRGSLSLTLSVVAGNTAHSDGSDIEGNVTSSGGGNVIGNTADTGGFITSDKTNTDPKLVKPLASNGGTVQTTALQPGSPAIDILVCPTDPTMGSTLATDARGITRTQHERHARHRCTRQHPTPGRDLGRGGV